tara:strand:+ start:10921 stop:11826 length:906 start_codon:yes stop_codon:yes gene_type:complete
MKKIKFFYYIIAVSLLMGCGSDDTETNSDGGIVADFSFTNDDNLFVFTNLSQGATTYRWDLGNLSFYCDKENPTYRYTSVGGEIAVTLTAMNDAGQEAYITKKIMAPEVKNVDIKIDGDFSDWDDVEVLLDQSTSGAASMQKIKMWGAGDNINVYIEGNASMKMELIDMYINADSNPDTGYLAWQWPVSSGADFLFEGPPVNDSWATFFQYTGVDGGWGWAALSGSIANFKSSGLKSVNTTTNAIEFSMKKTQFGALGDTFSLSIAELTGGWASVGEFPIAGGTSSFVSYTLPAESSGFCE